MLLADPSPIFYRVLRKEVWPNFKWRRSGGATKEGFSCTEENGNGNGDKNILPHNLVYYFWCGTVSSSLNGPRLLCLGLEKRKDATQCVRTQRQQQRRGSTVAAAKTMAAAASSLIGSSYRRWRSRQESQRQKRERTKRRKKKTSLQEPIFVGKKHF